MKVDQKALVLEIFASVSMEWVASTKAYTRESVSDCIASVLSKVVVDKDSEAISAYVCLQRIVSGDILSDVNVPQKPTSILDGFAMRSGTLLSEYRIVGSYLAGSEQSVVTETSSDEIIYVATGAEVPPGYDCVVPVEQCKIQGWACEITQPGPLISGSNIRAPGSDTRAGTVIIPKGAVIGAGEQALLNACMVKEVPVYTKRRVAILSTGAEIASGQVGDANKAYLLSRLREDDMGGSLEVIDLGVVADDKETFANLLTNIDYDIFISTGSVSKGKSDFMKPVLEELGFDILFGQVDVKPGKPTSAAIHPRFKKMVFALPGNPASCFVTFNLFVIPAIYKMTGRGEFSMNAVSIRLYGVTTIQPDPERPEYLRAVAYINPRGQLEAALIEGSQRSSRAASCSGHVNSLVKVPPGNSPIFVPEQVFEAFILPGTSLEAHASADPNPLGAQVTESAKAKAFDSLVEWLKLKNEVENIDLMNLAGFCRNCLSKWLHAGSSGSLPLDDAKKYVYGMDYEEWKRMYRKGEKKAHAPRNIPAPKTNPCASSITGGNSESFKACVLTVSDRAHAGIYEDISGQTAEQILVESKLFAGPTRRKLVPDERESIKNAITEWISRTEPTVIFSTGGTGFTQRDVTPEAVKPLLEKEAPGLVHLVLNCFVGSDPMHSMTRPVIGSVGKTLIVTLPGSPQAVKDGLACLLRVIPKALHDLNR
jgi:gephyrin